MSYLDTLESYLGGRYSPGTISVFTHQAAKFLATIGVKAEYSREDILRYTNYLISQGQKSQSVSGCVTAIKALFRANGLAWPMQARDMHLRRAEVDPANAPMLSVSDAAKMIEGARADFRYPDTQLVALSTLWGFRASELARILTLGCNGRDLTVETSKTGRHRVHRVPTALASILSVQGRKIGTSAMHPAYDRIVERYCRRAPAPREGWHSVRRMLASELYGNGVDELTISHFFGWARPGMASRYIRPQPLAVDRAVFLRHPLLSHWIK